MLRTYTATGINLKSAAFGESDRLLTLLSPEYGLIRAVAPGARKPKSALGGRSGLFVVNNLLLHKGRSLDRITQAESVESYPHLSQDLGKLASAQYLAEMALGMAVSESPQPELFSLFCEHLHRLNNHCQSSLPLVALLVQGVYHLLALDGIAPQVQRCCLTQQPLNPEPENPNYEVGFSIVNGGCFLLATDPSEPIKIDKKLNALQLILLQQLAQPQLDWLNRLGDTCPPALSPTPWLAIERILRHYAEYHLERSIRSAPLIDNYFAPLPHSSLLL